MSYALRKMTFDEAMRFHQIVTVTITKKLLCMRCDGCGRRFKVGEVVLWGDNDDWYCDEECFARANRYELLDD